MSQQSPNQPLLLGKGIVKSFPIKQTFFQMLRRETKQRHYAVNAVDFSIQPGEVVGLVGESGCGKTTLGKVICRLIDGAEGKLLFQGEDFFQSRGESLRKKRRDVQMLFQNPYSTLNPKQTVFDSLEETLLVNTDYPTEKRWKYIREVLQKVDLLEKETSLPTELSGGERRRVGLAKVLLLQPLLIVADEPVAGLDASIKAKIVDLMLEVKTENMAYLFISHDLHVIRYVSDRIFVMFLGKMVEEIPVEKFNLHEKQATKHHPYTETLLTAAKRISLQHNEDNPVSMEEISEQSEKRTDGCPFVNRCPLIGKVVERDLCIKTMPELTEVEPGHRIACHAFHQEEESEIS